MKKRICMLLEQLRQKQPLVHCITNPISINDCANALLAVGARPMMAEHPREVAGITAHAGALLLNLGNITDVRMESMQLAGQAAMRLHRTLPPPGAHPPPGKRRSKPPAGSHAGKGTGDPGSGWGGMLRFAAGICPAFAGADTSGGASGKPN